MKMYNKNDLQFVEGYLVTEDGDVVCVDPLVVKQANELETLIQKKQWIDVQPKACAGPDWDDFERTTTLVQPSFKIRSELLDKKIEESMEIMEALDREGNAQRCNEMAELFEVLIQFAESDVIIETTDTTSRFDVPVLENPLGWSAEYICAMIAMLNDFDIEDIAINE